MWVYWVKSIWIMNEASPRISDNMEKSWANYRKPQQKLPSSDRCHLTFYLTCLLTKKPGNFLTRYWQTNAGKYPDVTIIIDIILPYTLTHFVTHIIYLAWHSNIWPGVRSEVLFDIYVAAYLRHEAKIFNATLLRKECCMPGVRSESSVCVDLSAHFFSEPFSNMDASSSPNLFSWGRVQWFHGVWAFNFESFCWPACLPTPSLSKRLVAIAPGIERIPGGGTRNCCFQV